MVEVAKRDVLLPWDAFLEEAVRGVPDSQRNGYLSSLRLQIEGFRSSVWPNLKRELDKSFNWEVSPDLEPHWVGSGRAVWWQETVVRKRVQTTSEDGTVGFVALEVSCGWQPTTALRTNSASQIADYLNRGLRMRPPVDGSDLTRVKGKVTEEDPKPTEPSRPYGCQRHASGPMRFVSWKAYLRHCNRYQEPPLEEPPPSIKARLMRFQWYCLQHDQGFNNERLATRHVREEGRRPRLGYHPTLQDMEVKR